MTAVFSTVSSGMQYMRKTTAVEIGKHHCLSLWYYMRSNAQPPVSLTAQLAKGDFMPLVFWQSSLATTANRWEFARIALPSVIQDFIEFGAGPLKITDVVAIDDISLTGGECPHTFDCTFEEDNLCGYQPVVGYDDWVRWLWVTTGTTDAVGNAPARDHTNPNNLFGHYLLVDLPTGNVNHDKSQIIILSPSLDDTANPTGCLSLWYQIVAPLRYRASLQVLIDDTLHENDKIHLVDETGPTWTLLKLNIKQCNN